MNNGSDAASDTVTYLNALVDIWKETARRALDDEATMRETLKHAQGRCTELLDEVRRLRVVIEIVADAVEPR